MKFQSGVAMLAALMVLVPFSASANNIIDFEGFDRGTIIDDEYVGSQGVTIRGYNRDRQADNIAVIFDTTRDDTADPDLEAPFYNTNGQNLGVADPGNVLIIHEHPWECNGVTCGDDPDDEGSRPAGYFSILFDRPVTLNSIDFFDVERAENGYTNKNRIIVGGTEDSYSPFFTPETGGNNQWARLNFNVVGVTSVMIKLHGSGAIDNINYSESVSTPAGVLLFALGLAGVFTRRTRKS